MTSFTTEDRLNAEKLKETPPDWDATSAPWPFTEADIVEGETNDPNLSSAAVFQALPDTLDPIPYEEKYKEYLKSSS
jgi:hypothetical protein